MTFEEWYAARTKTWHESARHNKRGISAEAWDASRAAALAEVAKWHEERAIEAMRLVEVGAIKSHQIAAAHFREIGGGA